VSLRNALAHLTALRIPPRTRVPITHSLHYFPWVGAAHGSLNILGFIAASQVLPVPLACLFAVLLPQALAGFAPWRGVLEAVQGRHTRANQPFAHGFRPDLKGVALVLALTLIKWFSLMIIAPDWRVRAALAFPVLGMSAQTWAFLRSVRMPGRSPLLVRRHIRAGFLSTFSLFLVFLFPLRAGAVLLLAGAVATWLLLRFRHPRRAPASRRELTRQTAGLVTEVSEAAMLAALVFAGFVLF
jgi:cobalamin synthase